MLHATSLPHAPASAIAPVGIGWRHPHYGALLQQRPELDFIEVHSENFFADGGAALSVLHQGRDAYPVSLHGVGLSLGSAMGIDPVRVSDHASFARVPLAGQPVHAADLLPVPMSVEALDVMCANVQRVQDRLQRPIAVENLSAYVMWPQADMDEPAFLNALAQRTGCGLLVDVNNIYVNALNAQLRVPHLDPLLACRQWLDAIDTSPVAELHLAGHVHCGDIVIDDHGSTVQEPVWQLYAHAVQRFGTVPTLIEWDTDVPALSVLLGEARQARELSAATLKRCPTLETATA